MKSLIVNRMNEVYPELQINKIEENHFGQNNHVLIVNERFVFRFPKYMKGIHQLQEETTILSHIKEHVTLPTPFPVYQSFQPLEVGKVFTGYDMIEGEPLWKDEFFNIKDEESLNRLATQLVGFLTELHTFPKEELRIDKRPDVMDEISRLFKKFQNQLYPFMSDSAKGEVTSMFDSFIRKKDSFSVCLALIHGDFGASNILWDKKESCISGIIDFGGSGIGDPAYDFAGLLSSYGQDFFNRCIDLYPNGKEIAERVFFYRKTFALLEALHGLEHGDRQAFENGIKEYI